MRSKEKIKDTTETGLAHFFNLHARQICFTLGSLFISLWTLLRFFSVGSTFDLVGQQLLTRQWLDGSSSHAVVGTTNYLWKMVLFYAPLDMLPGSPRIKLTILTVIVNILTFILLAIVLEKILREIGLKITPFFYGALLWLTLIAGSVFWIQFTNSRNLEVVGGAFLIYLSIRIIKEFSWKRVIGATLFVAVLFFSDPIQLYMTAIPIVIFALIYTYKKSASFSNVIWLLTILLSGFLGAKAIALLASHLFSIQFSKGPGLGAITDYTVSNWIHNAAYTGKSFIQLYEGGHELGRLVQIINLCLLAVISLYFFAFLLKKKHSYMQVAYLVLSVFTIDAIVYLFSGQAFTGGTSRYLIMTVPMMLVIFGIVGTLKLNKTLTILLVFAILANVALLVSSTSKAWSIRSQPDQHLLSTLHFLNQNQYIYAFASMDSSIPISYYYKPQTILLPLSCDGLLGKSYLFFDKSVFTQAQATQSNLVPIILDGDTIRNYPNTCTQDSIFKQIGRPTKIEHTENGSTVLLYRPADLVALQ